MQAKRLTKTNLIRLIELLCLSFIYRVYYRYILKPTEPTQMWMDSHLYTPPGQQTFSVTFLTSLRDKVKDLTAFLFLVSLFLALAASLQHFIVINFLLGE